MTLLTPILNFPNTQDSISLSNVSVEFTVGGKQHKAMADIRLRLAPKPRVFFRFDDVNCLQFSQAPNTIKLLDTGEMIEGFQYSHHVTIGKNSKNTMEWQPRDSRLTIKRDKKDNIHHVVFHLLNYVDFLGTSHTTEKQGDKTAAIHILTLHNTVYKITIQSLFDTGARIKKSRADHSNTITHVGKLSRQDGKEMAVNEAEETLRSLTHFLSCTAGRWVHPFCPYGYDGTGTIAWQQASSPSNFDGEVTTFFDEHHTTELEKLFPLFMEFWNRDEWRKMFEEVLYWYIIAARPDRSIESSIIMTQVALERISYEYTVNQKKLITKQGFTSLWASDRIRLLLGSLGIPSELPTMLCKLSALSKKKNWEDAPHAITEIRNAIIHPDKKDRNFPSDVNYECWKLGMWLFDLSMLRLFGYSGEYADRLRTGRYVGEKDKLPWSGQ